VAGTGQRGFAGDGGPATAAALASPAAICLDAEGSIYICDFDNHAVRKVAPDGTIQTIAGTGRGGRARDGKAAQQSQLAQPCGVAVDRQGRVYIADSLNQRIRVVVADGRIETVAGNGRMGRTGDGGPAREATISVPDLIDFDEQGRLYVAEFRNHVIRRSTPG
jgi:sugar lactone lactonase YvrE